MFRYSDDKGQLFLPGFSPEETKEPLKGSISEEDFIYEYFDGSRYAVVGKSLIRIKEPDLLVSKTNIVGE